jgi:signal transduction histidine kinase/ActR/RegA family two-component response regulator
MTISGMSPPGAPIQDQPEAIAPSRFLWLIGVFLAGLLLVVGLKAFFAHLQDELGERSGNERARLFIGEEIVRGMQEVEKDVYLMTTLAGDAAQVRKEEEIRRHVGELEHDLSVLKSGGTVRRVVDLNIEGHDQMVREVRYRPGADARGFVMASIEIEPLLVQINFKCHELRLLLAQRLAMREQRDQAGFFLLEQRISTYLKHLPPFFFRLNENANRLFFESSEHLNKLESQIARERERYQLMENLLVVLVIVLVTLAGILFANQIRESNRRLALAWEAMRAAKLEAERASRAKSEFVSRMSHELRTPMNAILGFAQLLEGERLEPEQRDFVNEINRAGVHLLELINQVLDLAKIEAGSMTLENIPFDLMKTVDEVATLVADRAHAQGLSLRFFALPELPPMVMGDPTRLRQVLINLIGNAVKFTHKGGIDLRVAPVEEGARIEFAVQDSGIGMDAETLARLFRPFAQADESITRKYGGSGLGLMISRDLVRAMGGDIMVESTLGQGSRFVFSLPARPVAGAPPRPLPLAGYGAMLTCSDAHEVEVLSAHLTALGAEVLASCGHDLMRQMLEREAARPWVFIGTGDCLATLEGVRHPGSACRDLFLLLAGGKVTPKHVDAVLAEPFTYTRLLDIVRGVQQRAGATAPAMPVSESRAGHVLLVEDNRINQMVAGRMLDKLGLTWEAAGNGREALEKCAAQVFDLVLMDMQMPEMDGIEATRALRAREAESGVARVPIIAMTANALGEDREQCLRAGMDDHLAKPVEMAKLAAALERWLAR